MRSVRICEFCGASLDGYRRNISRPDLKARRVDAVAPLPIPAHHLDERTFDRRPGLRRYAVWEVELHCVLDEFRLPRAAAFAIFCSSFAVPAPWCSSAGPSASTT